MDSGGYIQPRSLTLSELMDEWLDSKQGDPKKSTLASYRIVADVRIIPNLGSIQIQKLTTVHLNRLYRTLLDEPRLGRQKPLSSNSVRNTHMVMRGALAYAVDNGYIATNVALKTIRPWNACEDAKDPKFWTAEELRSFLAGIEDHPFYLAYYVAGMTGVRRGELLALEWGDIDFINKRMSIRRALSCVGYKLEVTKPKTKKSTRAIDLDPKTIAMLQEHHRQQAEEWLANGRTGARPSLLFTQNGSFIHPDRFSKVFRNLVVKSGLPLLRLHDVRHTHASLLLLGGWHPKVVQERLGHSSITVTMDLYSHLIPGMQETAAAGLSVMVFGE